MWEQVGLSAVLASDFCCPAALLHPELPSLHRFAPQKLVQAEDPALIYAPLPLLLLVSSNLLCRSSAALSFRFPKVPSFIHSFIRSLQKNSFFSKSRTRLAPICVACSSTGCHRPRSLLPSSATRDLVSYCICQTRGHLILLEQTRQQTCINHLSFTDSKSLPVSRHRCSSITFIHTSTT